MQFFRLYLAARGVVVALALVTWLIATNHCAFGLMKPAAQPAHAHCHGGAADRNAPVNGERECCRAIQGMPASGEAVFKAERVEYALPLLEVYGVASSEAGEDRVVCAQFAHDPPEAESFAECVLQRSLLSHAPPR